jgi:signal transduction histidine kinase
MNHFNAMDFPLTTSVLAGVLQTSVAAYAMWMTRRFGVTRVGWTVFAAFGTLGALNGLLRISPMAPVMGREMENVAYALTSGLLLIAMCHLANVIRGHERAAAEARAAHEAEERERSVLEAKAREATETVTKANEELRQTAARLEAEIAERERRKEGEATTRKEILEVTRQAGMSEVATAVLHNVGNVLNSVNISAAIVAEHVTDFKVDNIRRMAALMREQGAGLGDYMMNDPKGRQLPDYLAKLASHLCSEQTLILKEIGFVRSKIDLIKEIVNTQQNYGKVMGLTEQIRVDELVDDVLRIQAAELEEHQVAVKRQYETGLPEVVVDKHKILQILLNLFSNAKHACVESDRAEKQVQVRVTNGDDRVRVVVTDNGVGIPEKNLTAIFNHGFTTRKKGGHGFGLHSSALAAKEIGGALVVRSEGPGRGATFTLEIPIKHNAVQTN